MLQDAVDAEATGLFLELWVMAKHHGFGTEVINRFYERSARAIAEALSSERADLSKQELLRTAYFALVLIDGVGAVFSRATDRSVALDEVIPLAVDSVRRLLDPGGDCAPPSR
jgi:hypothetical protein